MSHPEGKGFNISASEIYSMDTKLLRLQCNYIHTNPGVSPIYFNETCIWVVMQSIGLSVSQYINFISDNQII